MRDRKASSICPMRFVVCVNELGYEGIEFLADIILEIAFRCNTPCNGERLRRLADHFLHDFNGLRTHQILGCFSGDLRPSVFQGIRQPHRLR